MVEEENDYGMGAGNCFNCSSEELAHGFAGYWKDSVPAKDYTQKSQVNENETQRSNKRRALAAMESDEEDNESQTLDSVKQPVRKQARTKDTKKLFLTSDDDDDDAKDDADLAIESSQEAPPAPTPAARARANKRRRVVADDDSDDGVAFKGFGKKRRVK